MFPAEEKVRIVLSILAGEMSVVEAGKEHPAVCEWLMAQTEALGAAAVRHERWQWFPRRKERIQEVVDPALLIALQITAGDLAKSATTGSAGVDLSKRSCAWADRTADTRFRSSILTCG